jgi:hypothetical protein
MGGFVTEEISGGKVGKKSSKKRAKKVWTGPIKSPAKSSFHKSIEKGKRAKKNWTGGF